MATKENVELVPM